MSTVCGVFRDALDALKCAKQNVQDERRRKSDAGRMQFKVLNTSMQKLVFDIGISMRAS